MSRIAKKPIEVPKDVTVEIKDGAIVVSGKLGKLTRKLHPKVSVAAEEKDGKKTLKVFADNADVKGSALQGLFHRLIVGMIKGVTVGFIKQLELVGIGYKGQVSGNKLVLDLGFSHQIDFVLPDDVSAKIEKNIITFSSFNNELLGNTVARIRSIRKPEPYKGKGIRYVGEVVRKKAGKAAVKTAA